MRHYLIRILRTSTVFATFLITPLASATAEAGELVKVLTSV